MMDIVKDQFPTGAEKNMLGTWNGVAPRKDD